MTQTKPLPTLSFLRERLDYSPSTGDLTWKERPLPWFKTRASWRSWNARYAGQPAGCIQRHGYLQIGLMDGRFRAHRIAFYLATGEQPEFLDHKDGDRTNNRLENLRACSKAENMRHRVGLASNNTSGVRGVSRGANSRKWVASLTVDGALKYLGSFTNKADAAAAAAAARAKYYGEFKGVDA